MFSPAGQASLQGGKRSTYTGRSVRQLPVLFSKLLPTSSVTAKGLVACTMSSAHDASSWRGEQVELADVAIGNGTQRFELCRVFRIEHVGEAALELQVIVHRSLRWRIFVTAVKVAVLGLR